MIEDVSMDRLGIGEVLTVTFLGGDEAMCRRLEDLGLTVGGQARCLMASPLGDPRAYEICGAVIALRQRDSARVFGTRMGADVGGRHETE